MTEDALQEPRRKVDAVVVRTFFRRNSEGFLVALRSLEVHGATVNQVWKTKELLTSGTKERGFVPEVPDEL